MTDDVLEAASQILRVCPLDGVYLEKTHAHIYCRFEQQREVLSSAVLGAQASGVTQYLNLRVDADAGDCDVSPAQTLLDYCAAQGWNSDCNWREATLGMMTAASMNSLRYGVMEAEGVKLLILLTCGLANARRAGDPADGNRAVNQRQQPGTINIAVIANQRLSQAAMVELLMMTTEAKCAALQNASVKSPVSGGVATGTGTDSVAIFNGLKPSMDTAQDTPVAQTEIQYCGKHTRLGEVFATKLMALLTDSFAADCVLQTGHNRV